MRYLITGVTGFIGSRLALHCLELGHSVRGIGQTNTPAETTNKQELLEAGAECFEVSVKDRDALIPFFNDIDVVFHLAAVQHEMNVPDSHFYEVNAEGTRNVMEAAVSGGVKCVVHGSTIGVYGESEEVLDEQSPTNPLNIYSRSKLEGERIALSYADSIHISAVRIPETYGPGDGRLLKLFRGIESGAFFHVGRGQNFHHLIFVDDLIHGLLKASSNPRAAGEIFLMAGKTSVTTHQMIVAVARALDKEPPKLRVPLSVLMPVAILMEKFLRPLGIQPPLHRRRLDFFTKNFSFSIQKARDLLGFEPNMNLDEGMKMTALWYQQKGYLEGGQQEKPVQVEEFREYAGDPYPGDRKHPVTAKMEPFDSFWEAPTNVEKGYRTFGQFYRSNYLGYLPDDLSCRLLVISCGPGYFVNLLKEEGYVNIEGIDADPIKIKWASRRGLNCRIAETFHVLEENEESYDVIIAEQEINHLTKKEIIGFFELCWKNLNSGGVLLIHSLNGANPITGSEAVAQNIDHYNSFTEYSLRQIFHMAGFDEIGVFPLDLYVFYKNPLNYIAMAVHNLYCVFFRFSFKLYGKSNKIFTKKIGAIGKKP